MSLNLLLFLNDIMCCVNLQLVVLMMLLHFIIDFKLLRMATIFLVCSLIVIVIGVVGG
ncbi:hypothetical protein SAMD00019534_124530 [Acytostelium subglobosum LB1]|uniref:hypothetical protein n=1 Tax=Acytostelium subglobosum LB1 TaxID=1410327 RepID=UPI0006451D76|nr:hypothetical protein SAMD00019534_124530 [Acytostelium subglobosum LB1]GAM29277.1 hypothetical protein SAMD00019534_124530 [Acytostelium subglobosum LB1]|eukprot:XP_012747775.1 hypothetical protein SAMD00019534_124530 [Acytostelium subglobosum LB1]